MRFQHRVACSACRYVILSPAGIITLSYLVFIYPLQNPKYFLLPAQYGERDGVYSSDEKVLPIHLYGSLEFLTHFQIFS